MRHATTRTVLFVFVCLGALSPRADAAEKRGEAARHADCCATLPCCPDDYCKKPIPCVAPAKWCGVDDYCKKPMPCIASPTWCGACDDYCKKPFPNLCLPRNWQFYRCLPGDCQEGAQAKPPAEPKPTPARLKLLPPTK